MEQSSLRLIKRCSEFIHIREIDNILSGLRGIYVLYKKKRRRTGEEIRYELVYVGMTNGGRGGIRQRLRSHRTRKKGLWTHCSIFEVWDNIRDEEVVELEGLFRHLYRFDDRTNRLNAQRGFKKLAEVRNDEFWSWE